MAEENFLDDEDIYDDDDDESMTGSDEDSDDLQDEFSLDEDDEDDDDAEDKDDDDDDDEDEDGEEEGEDGKKGEAKEPKLKDLKVRAPGEEFGETLSKLLKGGKATVPNPLKAKPSPSPSSPSPSPSAPAAPKAVAKKRVEGGVVLSKAKKMEKLIEKEKMDQKVRLELIKRKKKLLHRQHLKVIDYGPFHAEKDLVRTATRGVVQLFNAINKHQRELKNLPQDQEDSSALSNEKFIDLLKQSARSKTSAPSAPETKDKAKTKDKASADPKRWSILNDDYALGSKGLKDWDRESDSDDDPFQNTQNLSYEIENELELED
eukprot:TRINITY_DN2548_c0_g1_i3.p2 TRINITY_DN2548_c0_g1~~TRINITY_DN2548_c0_g1_i3.p2  ORF type:complete len:345 (-),score=227.13 TRINITY_DN2548_c0_g1_i3:209-1165(-)